MSDSSSGVLTAAVAATGAATGAAAGAGGGTGMLALALTGALGSGSARTTAGVCTGDATELVSNGRG